MTYNAKADSSELPLYQETGWFKNDFQLERLLLKEKSRYTVELRLLNRIRSKIMFDDSFVRKLKQYFP